MTQLKVPTVKWSTIVETIELVGSQSYRVVSWDAASFLASMGFIERVPRPRQRKLEPPPETWKRILLGIGEVMEEATRVKWRLTDRGKRVYMALFVYKDRGLLTSLVAPAALRNPVLELLYRTFAGRGATGIDQVAALLKLEHLDYLTSGIESAIDLLEGMGVVVRDGDSITFNLLAADRATLPDAYLLSPKTLYSNRRFLTELVAHCDGTLFWIDKFFSKEGLGYLIDGADGARLNRVVIISGEKNFDARATDHYADARVELLERGIKLEWRICRDVDTLKVWHGRWIVSASAAWNVPPVRSVAKGQFDEILPTDNKPPIEHFLAVSSPADVKIALPGSL